MRAGTRRQQVRGDRSQLTAEEQDAAVAWYSSEDGDPAVIEQGPGYAGDGWYVWLADYPDEGSIFLGVELLSPALRALHAR